MLQVKPYPWACAITSLAMTLRIPVQELILELGHDGSEIAFPSLREPLCRRGFHSQELIFLAESHGFAITPIELFPQIKPVQGRHPPVRVFFGKDAKAKDNWLRFQSYISETMGILEGVSGRREIPHAVHHRFGDIWDPDGEHYVYSQEACEQRGFIANRLFVCRGCL